MSNFTVWYSQILVHPGPHHWEKSSSVPVQARRQYIVTLIVKRSANLYTCIYVHSTVGIWYPIIYVNVACPQEGLCVHGPTLRYAKSLPNGTSSPAGIYSRSWLQSSRSSGILVPGGSWAGCTASPLWTTLSLGTMSVRCDGRHERKKLWERWRGRGGGGERWREKRGRMVNILLHTHTIYTWVEWTQLKSHLENVNNIVVLWLLTHCLLWLILSNRVLLLHCYLQLQIQLLFYAYYAAKTTIQYH